MSSTAPIPEELAEVDCLLEVMAQLRALATTQPVAAQPEPELEPSLKNSSPLQMKQVLAALGFVVGAQESPELVLSLSRNERVAIFGCLQALVQQWLQSHAPAPPPGQSVESFYRKTRDHVRLLGGGSRTREKRA